MKKINLGCGWRDFGSDWIHIDGGNYSHLDSKNIIDLPYNDNTIDLIYASHVLEYFDRTEAIDVLNKWHSKLKPNGILRLAVPNFKEIARLYIIEGYDLSKFLGSLFGKMYMEEELIYHKTTYDFVSLSSLLSQFNFSQVNYYNWKDTEHAEYDDHSQAYIPHMDKENGTLISLNVEAVK